MVLLSILFPGSTLLAGPKHSTSVPSSAGVALPLSVDVKDVARVPNPVTGLDLKLSLGPQIEVELDLCNRLHSMLPFTLQVVTPLMFPVTVHLKVKVPPGQTREAAVKCPATSPA